jgi:hypothetical protein
MSVDSNIKEPSPFGTVDDFRKFCVDFIVGCLHQPLSDEPTTRKLLDHDIKGLITDEGGVTPNFATSFGKYLVTVIKNDGKMSNGKFLDPYPDKSIYEQIITKELSSLVMAMIPSADPDNIKSDVKTFVLTDGISNYHGGLGEYIMRNMNPTKQEDQHITFQELTELLSLLPPRAPKELEVKLYRDNDGRLKMQFVGEIDVATTAGKRQE